MNWKLPLVSLAAITASAVVYWQLADGWSNASVAGRSEQAAAPKATGVKLRPETSALPVHAAATPSAQRATTPSSAAGQPLPLGAASVEVLQRFEALRSLPPGDAAIALGQQLEAGINAENAAGYVQALLQTQDPAVERAAIAALARTADGGTLQTLAAAYGSLPAENRGRILQVLEQARNPEAVSGLAGIFSADTSEKRSPLVVSALYGIANIGSMDAVSYLLTQVTNQNADYALLALERVKSPQGRAMIQGAAEGSKDAASIPSTYRPALKRLAEAGAKS
jgi:folylpolyglutamate synthase/dihydropteroate synthase